MISKKRSLSAPEENLDLLPYIYARPHKISACNTKSMKEVLNFDLLFWQAAGLDTIHLPEPGLTALSYPEKNLVIISAPSVSALKGKPEFSFTFSLKQK